LGEKGNLDAMKGGSVEGLRIFLGLGRSRQGEKESGTGRAKEERKLRNNRRKFKEKTGNSTKNSMGRI